MAENVYLVFRNNSLHSVWHNVQDYIYLIEAALTDKSNTFFLLLFNTQKQMQLDELDDRIPNNYVPYFYTVRFYAVL